MLTGESVPTKARDGVATGIAESEALGLVREAAPLDVSDVRAGGFADGVGEPGVPRAPDHGEGEGHAWTRRVLRVW